MLWKVSWTNILLMLADRPGFEHPEDQPNDNEEPIIIVKKEDLKKHRQQLNGKV